MDLSFIQLLWFILIAVLWTGYLVLEGFDFGVGMLLPSYEPRMSRDALRIVRCAAHIRIRSTRNVRTSANTS